MKRSIGYEFFQEYTTELKRTLDNLPWEKLQEVVNIIHRARVEGRQVFVMGNGGSASTATHMACDIGKNTVFAATRVVAAISLNDNMAFFSAFLTITDMKMSLPSNCSI